MLASEYVEKYTGERNYEALMTDLPSGHRQKRAIGRS